MRLPPDDWADVEAWNVYHAEPEDGLVSFHVDTGLRFVPALREQGFARVWFPGSGTSWLPRVCAELGFDVLSTDFSPVAVAWQREAARSPLPPKVESGLAKHRDSRPPAVMRVEQHDFRQTLSSAPFDVVLNVRAFQGLAVDDMRAAARVHGAAVRSGGWAIFDTSNVQGTRRDDIEDALIDGGFVVPFHETERWYRAALRATGVPFVMILGRPRVYGDARTEQNQAALDALSTEYRERGEAEAKATESLLSSPTVKIAHVVYSTG